MSSAATATGPPSIAVEMGKPGSLPYNFTRKEQSGLVIYFEDLCYSVKSRRNPRELLYLLKGCTGVLQPGELVALMGPSGAGKTTLLDLLAARKSVGSVEGVLRFNGHERGRAFPRYTAYVEQFDVLCSTLTVYQNIFFAARLKMPRATVAEARATTEELIESFGLEECKDVLVGTPLARGVSGGQAKRTSIAVQLTNKPGVIFLDEPTSGLDSSTTHELMRVVRGMASEGRTVVSTIHQPSAEVFQMFDQLMLLDKGHPVYHGPTAKALPYFQQICAAALQSGSVPPRSNNNPAELILDCLQRNNSKWLPAEHKVDLAAAFSSSQYQQEQLRLLAALKTRAPSSQQLMDASPYANNFVAELIVMVQRQMKAKYTRALLAQRVMPRLFMGLIIASIWSNLGRGGSTELQNRNSVLFMITTFTGMSGNFYTPDLMEDRTLFVRERDDRFCRPLNYLLSQWLIQVPPLLLGCVFFSSVTYFSIGLSLMDNGAKFGFFVLTIISVATASMTFIFFLTSVSPNAQIGAILAIISLLIQMLFCGFLVLEDDIPDWWIWAHFLSFFKYGFTALFVNEHTDETYRCSPGEVRCFPSGSSVLSFYGFESVDKWTFIGVIWGILACWLGLAALALANLRYTKR